MTSICQSNPLFPCKSSIQGSDDDSMLNKKMMGLSVAEREQAIHGLHGLDDVIEETDEFIANKLEEIDKQIENIPNRRALDIAIRKSRDYVMGKRLMFLRSQNFDSKLAGELMGRFFALKLTLFGEEKLVKEITWWDLMDEDRKALAKGGLQLLPLRDRSGRAIIFRIGVLATGHSLECQKRITFFLAMNALDDEESQKRGQVLVFFNVGMENVMMGGTGALVSVLRATPNKICGTHLCFDNPRLEKLFEVTKYINKFGFSDSGFRFRTHFGSYMEGVYALMTFGIIREVIPVTVTGGFNLDFHREWLKKIQAKPGPEEGVQEVGRRRIVVPGTMDITLGRGRHATNSLGNIRFKNILESYRLQYDSVPMSERKVITRIVLLDLKEAGVRFIKPAKTGDWEEISEKESILKISHGFRNLRLTNDSSNASKVAKTPVPRKRLLS